MKEPAKLRYFQFWDHAHWSGGKARPIVCEVVGAVVAETDVAYSVAVWIADSRIDENAEQFCIIKGAIIEMREVRIGRKISTKRRSK
jgi:hypothetical protein